MFSCQSLRPGEPQGLGNFVCTKCLNNPPAILFTLSLCSANLTLRNGFGVNSGPAAVDCHTTCLGGHPTCRAALGLHSWDRGTKCTHAQVDTHRNSTPPDLILLDKSESNFLVQVHLVSSRHTGCLRLSGGHCAPSLSLRCCGMLMAGPSSPLVPRVQVMAIMLAKALQSMQGLL